MKLRDGRNLGWRVWTGNLLDPGPGPPQRKMAEFQKLFQTYLIMPPSEEKTPEGPMKNVEGRRKEEHISDKCFSGESIQVENREI